MTSPPHGRNPFAEPATASVPAQAEAPVAPPTAPYYADRGDSPICDICGAYPAAETTLRLHRGLVVVMSTSKEKGTYCRDCGTAVFREAQGYTLKMGWWSLWSLLVGPLVMLANLRAQRGIDQLAPPRPGAPRAAMRAGKPVRKRPWFATVIVFPLLLVAVIVNAAVTLADGSGGGSRGISDAAVGDCVRNQGSEAAPRLTPIDCDDSTFTDYTVAARLDGTTSAEGCPSVSVLTYARTDGDPFVLCLVAAGSLMLVP